MLSIPDLKTPDSQSMPLGWGYRQIKKAGCIRLSAEATNIRKHNHAGGPSRQGKPGNKEAYEPRRTHSLSG
jgi:hypothetical protein